MSSPLRILLIVAVAVAVHFVVIVVWRLGERVVAALVKSLEDQLPGIFRAPPSMDGRFTTSPGKEFLRIRFYLWPGWGAPIETNFKQEVVQALKALDPSYGDWKVAINYKAEKKSTPLSSVAVRKTGARE